MCGIFVKLLFGLGLGLLWRLDAALAPLGVSPWQRYAEAIVARWPINNGTGFFVSAEGHLLSAHHVVERCSFVAVGTPEGLVVGTPAVAWPDLDLALVSTGRQRDAHAALPGSGFEALWQAVTIVRYRGCGGPASLNITDARATSIGGGRASVLAISAAAPIVGGNSGSPVIDGHGAVVGMLIARDSGESRNGFAVDAPALLRFLATAQVAPQQAPAQPPFLAGSPAAAASRYTFPVYCLL